MSPDPSSERRPSRRALARGAAWSVPAIAVASIVPAGAATSFPDITCLSAASVSATDTGLKSWTAYSGLKRTYDTASSDVGMGTAFTFNMGQFQFNRPARYVTGYRMAIGNGGIDAPTAQARIKTVSGVVTDNQISTTGTGTAMVIGAGLQQSITVQSTVPYKLVAKKAANVPAIVSIPFCLTYLAGLNANVPGNTEVGRCCYWINYTYNYTRYPDVFGNYPDSAGVANSGNAWTITSSPAI